MLFVIVFVPGFYSDVESKPRNFAGIIGTLVDPVKLLIWTSPNYRTS